MVRSASLRASFCPSPAKVKADELERQDLSPVSQGTSALLKARYFRETQLHPLLLAADIHYCRSQFTVELPDKNDVSLDDSRELFYIDNREILYTFIRWTYVVYILRVSVSRSIRFM